MLWEGAWKGSLKGISTELLQASIGTLDTFGKVITMDPLSGEGEWAETKDQMRALSKGLLDKIRTAAKQAFQSLPVLEPPIGFSDLKQLPDERFRGFVNRVTVLVEKQVDDPSLRAALLLNWVKVNANAICQQVIVGLPFDPPPTLTAVIEGCSAKVPLLAQAEEERGKQLAAAVSAVTVSAVTASVAPASAPPPPLPPLPPLP